MIVSKFMAFNGIDVCSIWNWAKTSIRFYFASQNDFRLGLVCFNDGVRLSDPHQADTFVERCEQEKPTINAIANRNEHEMNAFK